MDRSSLGPWGQGRPPGTSTRLIPALLFLLFASILIKIAHGGHGSGPMVTSGLPPASLARSARAVGVRGPARGGLVVGRARDVRCRGEAQDGTSVIECEKICVD
eukprot:1392693-Amorphochlora_amoeboformis.AAC.2